MATIIEKAQRRMMEEDEAGNDCFVRYWAAYIDGANAQKREFERMDPFIHLQSNTIELCNSIKEYAKKMEALADETIAKL